MRVISEKFRQFRSDERGIALILVSIMLPVIIGFSLLVIDWSRAGNLHNDLQKAADSFALAAAAELDRSAGSWARAEHALATLVENTSRFSEAGFTTLTTVEQGGTKNCNSAGSISWCFLKSLPAEDRLPITSANNYADPDPAKGERETRFIQVKVNPAGFAAIFPASFLTGDSASNSMNIGAEAVAGFTSGVCDYTPVFICNPYETPATTGGITLEEAATTRKYRRRQILMRMNGSYMPGNFAFLESPDGNGAQELERMLASTKPRACYSQEGVNTEPGQMAGPVENGLNARFGINASYFGTPHGPAENVRMGAKSVQCKNNKVDITWETDPARGVGLERDSCQIAGTCTMMDKRMGEGDWNFTRYWQANHTVDGVTRPVPAEISGTGDDLPTRYEVYRQEIKDKIVGDPTLNSETGVPACSQQPVTSVDRRILYGAIIDCAAIEASGQKFSGRLNDIPVRAFGSFFITEPIKIDKDIYVELVDITGRGGRGTLDNFLRDEAQLYR
ncbi:hypothetical protein EET67_18615 [Pseudaminobacter arsenicus]|uniref:Putative Flp pilus-assembly TadG-like N-terminal domain-containing protein n=1 Tax=Borborobacter arsenicus TaxID=1851146 RepID=A0A432V2G5_9HYPH|nr:pilus assembly protein TadG-related protein [Pseudaminobacter arsenicus]RUM96361.1 hypothetical protein EET67_18615 [Pseudaminobacter arsenicus]